MNDHNQTGALQAILTDVDKLLREKLCELGLFDTPFVVAAVSPNNEMILRGNVDPLGLKMMAEELHEAADEVIVESSDRDAIH